MIINPNVNAEGKEIFVCPEDNDDSFSNTAIRLNTYGLTGDFVAILKEWEGSTQYQLTAFTHGSTNGVINGCRKNGNNENMIIATGAQRTVFHEGDEYVIVRLGRKESAI